ncbi:uncharacterized protein N0V89_001755 [Didymosphaeria variabile]|uniref:Uncharacterized protein n=1 Tax=Didymosphaeria variabile TaxID=1932322 RepID=A0A9W8XT68_9PLEO|nr:uncharacterized protein N0V89_001755 [Didymosphaeria variabile]KAJ4357180.1 hypothetical protein N0V89_001755 [Didymosphaeria variabile]
MDRTYYVAARTPQSARSVKEEQVASKPRPRPGEVVDWPKADGPSDSGIYQSDEDRSWDPLKSFSGAEDKSSVASSDEGSIFSIASLASSATDLSKASGYSATQIATATREVLLILRDDEVLQPLYKTAIEGDIGPDRFVNNFRRLLKLYAEDLKEEARDRIEFLAARLVAVKARHLAESILEKFWNSAVAPTLAPLDSKSKAIFAKEDSSDEEGEDEVEDDGIFQDLVIAQDFLVESNAFDDLRSRFREFIHSPKASTKKPTAKGKERALDEEDDSYSGKTTRESFVAAFSGFLGQDEPGDLAVARFTKAFAHDPELHELHKAALAELEKELLVTKYSRILVLYFKDLSEEAERETDRAIIQEFRKRSNIKIIVNATFHNIILDIVEVNERALLQRDSSSLTSRLAEQQQRVHNHTELRNSPDSEHRLDYNFLQRGVAFRKMALKIRLLSLPTSLREIVETVPKSTIKLSSVHNTSVLNKLKGFAEDHIVLEWDCIVDSLYTASYLKHTQMFFRKL